jgi:hypothetical protein
MISVLFYSLPKTTKSRRWRDLLFAVGIGYADITKDVEALVLMVFFKMPTIVSWAGYIPLIIIISGKPSGFP